MTRAGSTPEGTNTLQQCRGRTIYNATTTASGPSGEILDATLPNGEVDSTLMELAKILKEERLRVAEWQAFICGQGIEHWVHPSGIESVSTPMDRPSNMSRFAPSMSAGNSVLGPETSRLPLEGMTVNEAQLEKTFHQYFNVKEYMC